MRLRARCSIGYRAAALGTLVALGGCQAGVFSTPSPAVPSQATILQRLARNAKIVRHLYASVDTSDHFPSVRRYRLIDGIPAKRPDFVLRRHGGTIAVAGDATLYVYSGASGNFIYAFPPNGDEPSGRIRIPDPIRGCRTISGFTTVNAIAGDRFGNLFVGIDTYDGMRARERLGSDSAEDEPHFPCDGVVVFARAAAGGSEPIQTIRLPSGSTIQGVAVDTMDNLYIAEYPSSVEEFSSVLTHPARTRVFRSKYIEQVRSVATDSSDDIFISSISSDYGSGRINRYAPTAKGDGPPTSAILLEGSGLHFLPSIAVHGSDLYANDTFDSVDLYHARENGKQRPFKSLAAPNLASVAVGP